MPATLRDTILSRAAAHPDQVYVRCVFPDGSDSAVTYAGLTARGSQFATLLRSEGITPGEIVVVLLPHSSDLYSAFFGAILGGFVPTMLAVPSFKLNPEYYRQELLALLRRIEARALITDTATAEHLSLVGGVGPRLEESTRLVLADRLTPEQCSPPDLSVRPDDPVLLQHSSGSTGLKKGVALSNAAVLRQVELYAPLLQFRPEDRIASWLPLYHDMGLIACAVLPLVEGVPVSALSPFHWITRPASLLHLITEDRCTHAWLPNFAYEFMASRVRNSQLEGVRLDSMRAWINCSEPTVPRSHRHFLERFRPYGVREETLWTCYAAAETTFAVSQSNLDAPPRVERVDRDAFLTRRLALPAAGEETPALELMSGGRLLPETEIRIVSDEGLDLGERHVGEIAVRSASLFTGYFRDAEATDRALKDGWYFTGDLGYQAEGHLFITGRKKDVIIIAGKNYYPQDIERIVSDTPGIYPGRVVALGLDDPVLGTQRLIVLAEVSDPADVDSSDLAAEVRKRMSEHLDCGIDDLRLLPHMWLLKTSSGKIARAPNLKRYLELFGPQTGAAG